MEEKTKTKLIPLLVLYGAMIFIGGIFIGLTTGWSESYRLNLVLVSVGLPIALLIISYAVGMFEK